MLYNDTNVIVTLFAHVRSVVIDQNRLTPGYLLLLTSISPLLISSHLTSYLLFPTPWDSHQARYSPQR